MFVWRCYTVALCLLTVLYEVSSSSQKTSELGLRQLISTRETDVPGPNMVSRKEQPREQQSEFVIAVPEDLYEKDPEQILQHPALMKEIETHLQDRNGHPEVNEYQEQQKRQNTEIDSVIQQVFSLNDTRDHKNANLNYDLYPQEKISTNPTTVDRADPQLSSPRSQPFKVIIIKGGVRPPARNVLKRKLLLKRLKSPILRSSQSDSDTKSEQSSEELLHNILESIDQEDPNHSNPFRSAYLTKTTTYNISKLSDGSKNRSFLIEKLVNYSTNLNTLYSDNVPSNYSDTHSSVLQTIFHLDQHGYNDEPEEHGERYSRGEDLQPTDLVGSQFKSAKGNGDHESPTEFLGGQWTSKHTHNINENQKISDFVGNEANKGISSNKDLKPIPFDFVGGQFVEQPLSSDEDKSPNGLNKNRDESKLTGSKSTDNTNALISTSLDNSRNPQGQNMHTDIPVLENEVTDTQTESGYESSTSTDELGGNGETDPLIKKNNKVPNPSSILVKSTKTPTKAFGAELNGAKLTNLEENILGSKINGETTIDYMETTTTSGAVTLSEDSSLHSEAPQENGMKPFIRTGNRNALPESYDTPDSGNDEYNDSSSEFVGLKTPNNYDNILRADLISGKLITEANGYLPESTTETNSFESSESMGTKGHSKSDRFDRIVGEASDIEQSKLRSGPTNTEMQDVLSGEEQLSEEQNITGLVDDVELFAGKATVSEPAYEYQTTQKYDDQITQKYDDQTTQNYDSETPSKFYKSPLEISISDSSQETATELCLTLSNKNYPSLLHLISGNLYLEKDGQKIDLQLKDNPMKECNSGTKNCKLHFNLNNINATPITEEMFEVPEGNSITKYSDSKPKNGKRHITKENAEITKTDDIWEQNTEKGSKKLTDGAYMGNEYIFPAMENKPIHLPNLNKTEFSSYTENPSSSQSLPEKSIPVAIPLPTAYNSQNIGTKKTGKVFNDNIISPKFNGKNTMSKQTPVFSSVETTRNSQSLPVDSLFVPIHSSRRIDAVQNTEKHLSEGILPSELNGINDKNNQTEVLRSPPVESVFVPVSLNQSYGVQNTEKNLNNNEDELIYQFNGDHNLNSLTEQSSTTENSIKVQLLPVESVFLPIRFGSQSVEVQSDEKGLNDGNIPTSQFNDESIQNKPTEVPSSERPSRMQSMPVESIFVPINYQRVQNVEQQVSNGDEQVLPALLNGEKITLHSLDLPPHRFGLSGGHRLVRKIHQKRDSKSQTGGACGCNNPLLLSPSPIPDYRHFVGKRLAILTNMVHTVKDWVAQDPLRT